MSVLVQIALLIASSIATMDAALPGVSPSKWVTTNVVSVLLGEEPSYRFYLGYFDGHHCAYYAKSKCWVHFSAAGVAQWTDMQRTPQVSSVNLPPPR